MSTDIVKATRALPAPKNPMAGLVAQEIERLVPALPSTVEQDQMLAAMVVAANELDKPCDPKSVLMAAYACATLGLMPGKTLGLAYFVPFKGQCTLIPGYRGFMELAFRNRFLKSVHADVVYEGEPFRAWTTEDGPRLEHEPDIDRDERGGRVIAAYCIAQLASGGRQIRVLGAKQLAAADKGEKVWATHRHEMLLKTVIRRAAKHWRLTRELATAIRLDEEAERGDRQDFSDLGGLDATPAIGRQQHRVRSLKPQEPRAEPPAGEDPDVSGDDAEPPLEDWQREVLEQERREAAGASTEPESVGGKRK